MRIRREGRNCGKQSANVVKWLGTKTGKEVVSYTAIGVAGIQAMRSFTTLLCPFRVAHERGVWPSLSG